MRIRMLVAALFVALVPALAEAKTIRVPQNKTTIQAAVDAAKDGDTILVSNGSYSEDVVVSGRNNLKLRAVVNGKVKVRPTTTGVRIDASNRITVTGFAVIGGENGFRVNASNDVTITRFSVTAVSEYGVEALASNRVHVTFGRITNCGNDGISFADEDESSPVDSCDVKDVVVNGCDNDGIVVLGSNVLVLRCKVSGAGGDGFEANDGGAGPVTFRDCRSTNAGSDGFKLEAPNSKAISCTSAGAEDDGFDIEGPGSNVRLCTSTRSESNGYELNVDGATLFRCAASKSGDSGYQLHDTTNARLERCTATESGENGFFLDQDCEDNTLVGNTASKSAQFGLDDESTGDNTFTSNSFKTIDPN